MTEKELQRLLHEESSSVEWKAEGDPEKIVKTLTAYANDYEDVGSGTILCGVEEMKATDGSVAAKIVGISDGASRKLRDRIFELSRGVVNPPIAPQFDFVSVGVDKQVLVTWISASSELHAFKGMVVVRLGDKVTNATVNQISALAQRKAHLDWLAQPCPDATLGDVDLFALEEISKKLRLNGKASEFLEPNTRMFGSALPLTSRIESPSGSEVVPNRFALLLIGKEAAVFARRFYCTYSLSRRQSARAGVFVERTIWAYSPIGRKGDGGT